MEYIHKKDYSDLLPSTSILKISPQLTCNIITNCVSSCVSYMPSLCTGTEKWILKMLNNAWINTIDSSKWVWVLGRQNITNVVQRNNTIRHENMASVLASATTSWEILKKLQLHWAPVYSNVKAVMGRICTKAVAFKLFLLICSWNKILSERSKMNKKQTNKHWWNHPIWIQGEIHRV